MTLMTTIATRPALEDSIGTVDPALLAEPVMTSVDGRNCILDPSATVSNGMDNNEDDPDPRPGIITLAAYATTVGRTVTTSYRSGLAYGPAYVFECDGCDGIRGLRTADSADEAARSHAEKCMGTGSDPATPADDIAVDDEVQWTSTWNRRVRTGTVMALSVLGGTRYAVLATTDADGHPMTDRIAVHQLIRTAGRFVSTMVSGGAR